MNIQLLAKVHMQSLHHASLMVAQVPRMALQSLSKTMKLKENFGTKLFELFNWETLLQPVTVYTQMQLILWNSLNFILNENTISYLCVSNENPFQRNMEEKRERKCN